MLQYRSVVVCMERLQDLDRKQEQVLNEQMLYLFGKKESYSIMHQSTIGLYPFHRETNVMTGLVLLKLAGVWYGCQYSQPFHDKTPVFFIKSCTVMSLCLFSLCNCHVTLCGLLLALQKASCSLRLSTSFLSINRVQLLSWGDSELEYMQIYLTGFLSLTLGGQHKFSDRINVSSTSKYS